MNSSTPSIDPANDGELIGAFRHILGKTIQDLDGMIPAKVVKYDRDTNRATVQPLIMMITTDDQTITRAQIASVPVFQFGGGGFILSFNLQPDDLGWIKASDRDISLFLQSYKEAKPNTFRKHSFSDSVFYPDVMTGYTIAGEDSGNAVLQNLDGTVKISLGTDTIKIASSSAVIVETADATVTATGSVTVDSPSVDLGGSSLAANAGVVTGECIDPFTGAPFPDVSTIVKAKKA